jgi:hypothetical protein
MCLELPRLASQLLSAVSRLWKPVLYGWKSYASIRLFIVYLRLHLLSYLASTKLGAELRWLDVACWSLCL